MKNQICRRAKRIAWLLTLIYFGSYLMRINFAVMIVKICSDMNAQKTELAIVLTCLTVAYGVGQLVSGFLGDKIKPRYLVTAGLVTALACNTAMFFCQSIVAMSVVWTVNGLAHAMLWPPIVKIMSTNLNDEEYSYSAVRVSWGSSFATIFLYLACPLLLGVFSWRTVMLICAAGGAVILAVWFFGSKSLLLETVDAPKGESKSGEIQKSALPRFVILPTALIMLGIILQGILRDGVTNWMPSFLLESFGLPEEKAIVATVILALFSVISFYVFDLMHRRLFKNEVFCSAVIFALSVASATALYFINSASASVAASMLFMAVIVACMHGINLMLITVVPKRFAASGKVATFSGLFNSCTYIGAALSTYGFAAIAEIFGWGATILSWIAVSAAGVLVCLAATPLWKKFVK